MSNDKPPPPPEYRFTTLGWKSVPQPEPPKVELTPEEKKIWDEWQEKRG